MFHVQTNLPAWERGGRIALAALVAAGTIFGPLTGPLAWACGAVAATLLLTAVFGFCPACAMVGRRALPKE